jgi:hypothetical protein
VPPAWPHEFEHVLEMRAERIEQLEKRNRQLNASRKAIAAGQAAGTVIGLETFRDGFDP